MKRKTNLFYLEGEETNFITFSNYGESLTGNFLATDWKLYPTHFICMYCKFLDINDVETFEKRKALFTQYITAYYENKMAFLRDYCTENNLKVENELKPLEYLLEALFRFDTTTPTMQNVLPDGNNENMYISFVGDITEQDYNGIYTDIISFISSADVSNGNIKVLENEEYNAVDYNYKTYDPDSGEFVSCNDKLYGWMLNNKWIGPKRPEQETELTDYENVVPICDLNELRKYTTNNAVELILDKNDNPNIKFNLIIPLYDLVNNNIHTNATILEETQTSDESYIKNMPLGIWFTNTVIDLKRDNLTHYAPSWSLLLSAQFKPFPYSVKMPNEISQDATKEAFATYSQVLTRQNRLLNKLEDLTGQITSLQNQINDMNVKLNQKSSYYVDDIQRREIDFEIRTKYNIDEFKKEVYEYIKNNWNTDILA